MLEHEVDEWAEQHVLDCLRWPGTFHRQTALQLWEFAKRRQDRPGDLEGGAFVEAADRLVANGKISLE